MSYLSDLFTPTMKWAYRLKICTKYKQVYIFLCNQNIQKMQGSRLKLYSLYHVKIPSVLTGDNWPGIGLTKSYWVAIHSILHGPYVQPLWSGVFICCILYACNWYRFFHYPDPTILRVIIHAWVECFSFWKYPVWLSLNTIWDIFHIISLERYMWIWNISNLNTLFKKF